MTLGMRETKIRHVSRSTTGEVSHGGVEASQPPSSTASFECALGSVWLTWHLMIASRRDGDHLRKDNNIYRNKHLNIKTCG
eukprot:6371281-Amphidinium_carterae.1